MVFIVGVGENDACYELSCNSELLIGRGAQNHIVIPDNSISSDHAKISVIPKSDGSGEDVWLEDLNSRNGCFTGDFKCETKVSKKTNKISSVLLSDGSFLRFGNSPLKYTLRLHMPRHEADIHRGIPFFLGYFEKQPTSDHIQGTKPKLYTNNLSLRKFIIDGQVLTYSKTRMVEKRKLLLNEHTVVETLPPIQIQTASLFLRCTSRKLYPIVVTGTSDDDDSNMNSKGDISNMVDLVIYTDSIDKKVEFVAMLRYAMDKSKWNSKALHTVLRDSARSANAINTERIHDSHNAFTGKLGVSQLFITVNNLCKFPIFVCVSTDPNATMVMSGQVGVGSTGVEIGGSRQRLVEVSNFVTIECRGYHRFATGSGTYTLTVKEGIKNDDNTISYVTFRKDEICGGMITNVAYDKAVRRGSILVCKESNIASI